MSSALATEFIPPLPSVHSSRRRLLVCGTAEASAFIEQQLARTDYELQTATPQATPAAIAQFVPDVAFIELPSDSEGADVGLALARRLRGEAATYALPLAFVFHKDDAAVRRAALALGADDYFAVNASRAEILARLDALLWRVEAGRRSAATAHDQRAEIDNFMLLIEHVRAHIGSHKTGTLALIEMTNDSPDVSPGNSFTQAYGHFKLHLRRNDSVAFYGPTTLLAYLPQTPPEQVRRYLSRLSKAVCEDQKHLHVEFGTASFPADGLEVEELIGHAEVRLAAADADVPTVEPLAPPASVAPKLTPVALITNVTGSAFATPPTVITSLTNVSFPTLVAGNGAHGGDNGKQHQPQDDTPPASSSAEIPAPVQRALDDAVAQQVAPRSTKPLIRDPSFLAHINRDKEAFTRAAAEAAAAERELREQGVPMPRRVLLVVSDPARLAQLNSLVRSAGYEVRTAFAGQQALDLLRIERPEVLLLDYELYEIDGVETIRRLHRQERGRSTLPVVLLVGAEHDSARREALSLGARSVIALPYEPAELLRSVRAAGTTA